MQALPNITEIILVEIEFPQPTNKHDLIATYTTKFYTKLMTFLSITLNNFEDIYKRVHQ